jgi:hypothetical protein
MHSHKFSTAIAIILSSVTVAWAQSPTPTPVVSNIAVEAYAQSRGQDLSGTPCQTPGMTGCGGCYPEPIPPSDPIGAALAQLNLVNPEWQPIGPMIPGGDTSLPPASVPVRIDAIVSLSKSPGDDFPATHLTSDYNAELIPDDHGRLATGDVNRPDDQTLEFEWEGDKLPMYMWSGEGDRLTAEGRWIFDCGHADPKPQGKCSNDAAVCNVDGDCSGGTCSSPVPTFNYQAELHPPHAVAVLRNKSHGATPATRADVYISNDAGGASDRCTVTHLPAATDVLFNKTCLLNHCSVTTARSCTVDKDCAKGETCLRFDPTKRLANINASDFEFDMPLPPKPAGATDVKTSTTKMKVPKGSVMPNPIFVTHLTDPTPSIHVTVPMTVPIKGAMPNVFAQSITAFWKGDTTKLKHVQVKFTGLTITNPVKDSTPAVPRVCADPVSGPTTTVCTVDRDCAAGTCAAVSTKTCHANSECGKTDFCSGAARCIGGITPGWRAWGEVNGDWVEFAGVSQIGNQLPFLAPPYMQPSTPLAMKQKFKFDEYVPADGSIHVKVSIRSFGCLHDLFGYNLKELLGFYGFTGGGNCLLLGGSHNPGDVDFTLNGPDFGVTPGTVTALSTPASGGNAGTCSTTTSQLCVTSADCPSGETCTINGSGYTLQYTVKVFP